MFSLLGAPAILHERATHPVPCERRTQLLAYLALKRSWIGRAEVAALLWPDLESKLAYSNLRKSLHRMQTLPWAAGVEATGSVLRFAVATDVHAFESAIREQRIADALPLWRGELLRGFDDDANEAWTGWLAFERNRLRALWKGAAQQHLEQMASAVDALDLAARLLEADPLDEDALRPFLTWLVRDGQTLRARQTYQEFAARLRDELGIAPSADLVAFAKSLDTGAPHPATPAPAPVAAADDGFIGRSVELRRALALLGQDDCRLLSITGPGGVGKTRFARRVLAEAGPRFADGATFVRLDDLTLPTELAPRLASALGVVIAGKADALQHVKDALHARRTLLVLDNFEHLAATAPTLEDVLVACPGLKVVVTSRVRLALPSEWLLPLEGMPCPEIEDRDELESFDAARLFVRAARRVQPDVDFAREADAIVAICREVDGLPLALELAAAWTRALTCADIAAELARGAELLRAEDPARPARHASMEAVFEQSWRLLGERERAGLARLTVFRGGFTATAARAVGVPLPVLASLVDKSLVRKEGARCGLHPLVQQFAQGRLEQGGGAENAHGEHAAYYLRFLGEITNRLRQADPDLLNDLEASFENVRAAWRFAAGHGQGLFLARAAYSLMTFCDFRGRRLEGLELLREALANDAVARDPATVAPLATPAAWLAYRLDRYADAEVLARRALEASAADGGRTADPTPQFRAATVLGAVCARTGRGADSERWFELALAHAQKTADPLNVASALDNLGLVAQTARGDLDDALRRYREALLKHREAGDASGEAACLNNIGTAYIHQLKHAAGREALLEARALCERHGLFSTRAMVEVNLANIALDDGALDDAVAHALRAREVAERAGQRSVDANASHVLAAVALRRGDLATARGELTGAMAVSVAIGRPALQVQGIRLFAEVLAAQGDTDAAIRVMAFALQHPSVMGGERDAALRDLAAWGADPAMPPAWTGPALAELAHRIVAEGGQAYAPLLAELRKA